MPVAPSGWAAAVAAPRGSVGLGAGVGATVGGAVATAVLGAAISWCHERSR